MNFIYLTQKTNIHVLLILRTNVYSPYSGRKTPEDMKEGKPCIQEGAIGKFFILVVFWSFQHEILRDLALVEAEVESCSSALE